jgi:hypothetical protein
MRAAYLLVCLIAHADVIDRVAVTVDRSVVTESEILRDLRIIAFIDGLEGKFTPEQKRTAADRLVERMLIRREMTFSRYPQPSQADTNPLLAQIRQRFADDNAWRAALEAAKITEDELREYLLAGLRSMRFTDLRFRPGIQIPEDEIREAYEKREAEKRNSNGGAQPSTYEESREEIEAQLIDQRVEQALDRWLGEARTQLRIIYREEVFR